MTRSDYNPEMVENFRKQVLDYIVPVATSLYNRQEARLGYEPSVISMKSLNLQQEMPHLKENQNGF